MQCYVCGYYTSTNVTFFSWNHLNIIQDFAIFRKSKQGLIGRWTDSIQNISGVYLAKGRPADFDKMLQYTQLLTDKLSSVDKISQRVNKEQQGLQYFYA